MTRRAEQLRMALRLRRALAVRARFDRLDAEGRERWRAERLAALRRHAQERSPLYGRLHRGLESEPLAALPTVTKADVVERFDEIVTDRRLRSEHLRHVVDGGDSGVRALGRYRVGASSGSSGHPGLFPFDEAEWVGLLASAARARALAGRPPVAGRPRTAKIGSPSPWHLSHQVAATLQDPRKPALALSAAADVDELAAGLQAWGPDVLTGYPSVLAALAAEQVAGRLSIEPLQVFCGGERLTAAHRRAIVEAWGAEPFDQYLTTEAAFVAIECPAHDGLHVLDDHVVVEVVDEAGQPVEPGAFGQRVLLTVLGSRTLPLIRYELADAAAWAEGPCACGRTSPRLRAVAGQARGLLRLAAHDGGEVVVHPVAVTAVLDPAPVHSWQVVQEPERLRVLVVGPQPAFVPASLADDLRAAFVSAGALAPAIEVEVVAAIRRGPSGKASLIVTR